MSTVDVVAMSSEGVPTLTDEYQFLFLFFQVKLIRHSITIFTKLPNSLVFTAMVKGKG